MISKMYHIHIDGIGGYGKWDPESGVSKTLPPKGWKIDCLPCGYLRLFSDSFTGLSTEPCLSDFRIYSKEKK